MDKLIALTKMKEAEIQEFFGDRLDKEKRALLQLTKLAEEVGELTKEALIHLGYVRKEKMVPDNTEKVSSELCDVIITALITAEVFEIDIKAALDKRSEELKRRVC